MALRLGFKINRFLYLNRHKLQNVIHIKPYSQNSKPRCRNPHIKSASTLTKNQSDSKLSKRNDEQISSAKISTQNNFKGVKSPEIPVIPSGLNTSQVTIRRKFAKSSTQNAITRPLKLPRLANPFPEPVKTLPSETVSDEEKARLMHEQVKMEARFHLQKYQEMLLQHKMQNSKAEEESFPPEQETNYTYQQNTFQEEPEPNYSSPQQQNSYPQPNYPFPQQQQQNYVKYQQPDCQQAQQNNQNQKSNQQTKYRKPKDYKDLMQDDQAMKNQKLQQQLKQDEHKMEAAKKEETKPTEMTAEDLDSKRPQSGQCRKRRNTRAARYLRHSWYPRHIRKQISRQYSTDTSAINPEIISQSEKCDRVIKHLKILYPEYRNLTKPLFIPGSNEEKEFMKSVLKLIAKHKSTNVIKKHPAPFPSYSEIQTYSYDPKNENKFVDVPKNLFSPGSHRFYSTKKQKTYEVLSLLKEPVNKVIPKFTYRGGPVIFSPKKKPGAKKQEAPYPSYSEVTPDDEIASSRANVNALLVRSKPDNKYYSTSTKSTTELEKQAKKKPPCKSPFPPVPECDYAETARKKKEKKRKKHCPKKDKKCSPATDDVESSKIINKIKTWLSSYKPDTENIKITRSPADIDGRETYVIEVNELEEIKPEEQELLLNEELQNAPEIVEIIQPLESRSVFPNRGKNLPFKNLEYQPVEFKETHVLEMTDPIPVLTKNIPEFTSPEPEKACKPAVKPEINLKDNKAEVQLEDDKPTDVSSIDKVEKVEQKLRKFFFNKAKEEKMEEKVEERMKVNKVRQYYAPKPKPVEPIKEETQINKIKDYTLAKQQYEKAEIKTKEDRINKLSDIFIPKNKEDNVNKVKDSFKPKQKPFIAEEVQKIKEEIKLTRSESNKLKPTYKYIDPPTKQQKAFADFKDLNDFRNISLPQPCPIITKKYEASKPRKGDDCNNAAIKDGCKDQKKKDECPQKKCRYKKKRKVPKCEDVKGGKTCLPIYNYIPGLENKPEYALNPPKKTYFKSNISQYINLKPEEIQMLANRDLPKKDEFVPFKLKPQFWKKY